MRPNTGYFNLLKTFRVEVLHCVKAVCYLKIKARLCILHMCVYAKLSTRLLAKNADSKLLSFLCVPDVKCFVSVYHINMDRLFTTTTRSFVRYAIYTDIGPQRRINCSAPFWEYSQLIVPELGNDILTCFEPEPRADNLMVDVFRLAAPSLVGIIASSVFPKDTTARYAQYGYRTRSILKITIRRSGRVASLFC